MANVYTAVRSFKRYVPVDLRDPDTGLLGSPFRPLKVLFHPMVY